MDEWCNIDETIKHIPKLTWKRHLENNSGNKSIQSNLTDGNVIHIHCHFINSHFSLWTKLCWLSLTSTIYIGNHRELSRLPDDKENILSNSVN